MMGVSHRSVESVRERSRRATCSRNLPGRAHDADGPRREPHFDCASIVKCGLSLALNGRYLRIPAVQSVGFQGPQSVL